MDSIDIDATLDWACGDCAGCDGRGHRSRADGVFFVGGGTHKVQLCSCVVFKLAELQRTRLALAEALAELVVLRDTTGIETLRAGLREAATTIAKLHAEKRVLAESLEIAETTIILLTRIGPTEVDRA